MKKTFAIIKPDITSKNIEMAVLLEIARRGFAIMLMEDRVLTKEEAKWLYQEHQDKDFFNDQVAFMCSGNVILLLLQTEHGDTPERFRVVMGPTDFRKADPHTLRGKFATGYRQNAIHGSDGNESAKQEIEYFFGTKYS